MQKVKMVTGRFAMDFKCNRVGELTPNGFSGCRVPVLLGYSCTMFHKIVLEVKASGPPHVAHILWVH